jgi:hypothetical protein
MILIEHEGGQEDEEVLQNQVLDRVMRVYALELEV